MLFWFDKFLVAQLIGKLPGFLGCCIVSVNLELWEGAKKVAGVAGLIGVADELGIELLVTWKGDATFLPVLILEE